MPTLELDPNAVTVLVRGLAPRRELIYRLAICDLCERCRGDRGVFKVARIADYARYAKRVFLSPVA